MQFSDASIYSLLVIITVIGIAFFIFAFVGSDVNLKNESDIDLLIKQYEDLYDEDEIQTDHNWKQEIPGYMVTLYQTMEKQMTDIWINSLIFSITTCILFLALIASWVSPQGTFWGFFLAFIWGVIVAVIISYVYYRIKLSTLYIMPRKSGISKEDVLRWSYGNGFILALFIASLLVLNLLFVALIMKAMAVKITGQHFAIEMIGYPMGILIAGIYFREGISVTGRGIQAACDIIIRKDQYFGELGNSISYTGKVGAILSSIISDANYYDSMLAIALFISSPFIVMVYAEEYTYGDMYLPNMFGLIMVFTINLLAQFAVSFLSTMFQDKDNVQFTAKSIRFQIIFSTILSLILMILCLFATPKQFDYGFKDTGDLFKEKIYNPNVMGCGYLGIVINSITIIYSEYLTSHGYQTVKAIALSSENAPTLNIIHGYYVGYMGQMFPSLLLGGSIYISYQMCSMMGLIALTLGFMMNLIIIMAIQFLAQSTNDSLKCAFLAQFSANISELLHQMAWAARNYAIWQKVSNASIIIILSVALVGVQIYNTQSQMLKFNGYNIFGLILGSSLALFTKGMTLYSCKLIAEDSILEERALQSRKGKDNEKDAMENMQYDYFGIKNRLSNIHVLVTLVFCSAGVLFTGMIFGHTAEISLCIGYLLMSSLQMMSSIIIGNSLKNARIYNSFDERYGIKSQILASNVFADVQGSIMEETQNAPGTFYLVYVMLLANIAIEFFVHYDKRIKKQ